ncbi:hypothetical protein IFM89_028427, partial [Coptis chinensis]
WVSAKCVFVEIHRIRYVGTGEHKGSSSSDSQVSGGGGSCVSSKGKKKVEFDSDGQPVGDGSKGFSSLLGGTTKTHCPIS